MDLSSASNLRIFGICKKLQSILYHSSSDDLIKYSYRLKLLDEADSLCDFRNEILTEISQLKGKLHYIYNIDTETLIDFLSKVNKVELSDEQFEQFLLAQKLSQSKETVKELRKDINRLLELKNDLTEELNILKKNLIALDSAKENADILDTIKPIQEKYKKLLINTEYSSDLSPFDTQQTKNTLFSIRNNVLSSVFSHKNLFNPSNFKLHIIQSNSTDLNGVLLDFPETQVVVQSDPLSSSVFKITYSHFQHLIDRQNTKQYPDSRWLDILQKNRHQMVMAYKSVNEMFKVDNLINFKKENVIIDILKTDIGDAQ